MREGACDVLQQFVGCRDDSDATMCEGVYHRPRAVDSANALERSEQKGVYDCVEIVARWHHEALWGRCFDSSSISWFVFV